MMKMNMENETILGKRILLVDNERIERELIRDYLATDEHIVVEANNGAEAYSLFTQSRFDLVVTDSVMPFVSGQELAVRIKRVAPQQPILLITGEGDKRNPRKLVDAVLQKPFDYTRLQQELAKLL
jgi:two-component system, sensor histidine kinase and response regulator